MDIETFRSRYRYLEHECGHSLQKLVFASPGQATVGKEDVAILAQHLVQNYRELSGLASDLLRALETAERSGASRERISGSQSYQQSQQQASRWKESAVIACYGSGQSTEVLTRV